MHLLRLPIGFVLSMFVTTSAQPCAGEKPPAVKRDAGLGLLFCYAGSQPIDAFLKSTPCVSGVWWRCHKETKTYWVGELHYPTENTGNYKPAKGTPPSPRYYMVTNLRIRKRAGLPIDLRTFRGALVLKDPAPDKPLSVLGDGTVYELVGYQDRAHKRGRYQHLFARHPEFRYQPPPVDLQKK